MFTEEYLMNKENHTLLYPISSARTLIVRLYSKPKLSSNITTINYCLKVIHYIADSEQKW